MPTVDELAARLAAVEARLGPAPTATVPPIRLGELTDVPTPGSSIASTWAQEVTARARHRFPTVAARDTYWPPASAGNGAHCVTTDSGSQWVSNGTAWVPMHGTVLKAGYQGLPDQNTANTGWYDMVTIEAATTYPFPTITIVNGGGHGGFAGGGPCTFSMDLQQYATAAVFPPTTINTQAAVAAYTAVPLAAAFASAANASVGFKVRVQFVSGSNIHTGGGVGWFVYAS